MCIPEKIKIALAVPIVRVADVDFNVLQIENLIQEATDAGARIVVFPELSITGATCGDLFLHHLLVEKAHEGLKKLVNSTKSLDIVAIDARVAREIIVLGIEFRMLASLT